MSDQQPTLTRATLLDGVRVLTDRDAALARLVTCHGVPPLWARPPGFATLVRIILEQQVSLASAGAVYARLRRELGRLTPAAVEVLGRPGLQRLGLTRQKASYVSALAEHVQSGALPLNTLSRLPDVEATELLIRVPGIGTWSASIYLLMALRRPDVWPPGDLALRKALGSLHGREEMPTIEEATELAVGWQPWRAVAARILWKSYLAERAARSG